MNISEIYAIEPDADGWRILPRGRRVIEEEIGTDLSAEMLEKAARACELNSLFGIAEWLADEIAQLEAQVEAQGELLFQAGCNFVLNDQFYAGRTLFEAARRSGHLGAQEQLDALLKEGE